MNDAVTPARTAHIVRMVEARRGLGTLSSVTTELVKCGWPVADAEACIDATIADGRVERRGLRLRVAA